MLPHTEIFALNLENAGIHNLAKNGINIYNGSIGYLTDLKYGYSSVLHCLPNSDLPRNLHEYHVGIIDLGNERRVPYLEDEHTHKNTKSAKHSYLTCVHPQDLFDPRPFTLYLAREKFAENLRKGFLLIIFCSGNSDVNYTISTGKTFDTKPLDFLPFTPNTENRIGKKTKIPPEEGGLYNLLKKYNESFHYELIFDRPMRSSDGLYQNDPEFFPLVLSSDDNIVGLSWQDEKSGVFYLPNMENKGAFLKDFLTEIAPGLFPHLFPDIVKDKWLEQKLYELPNQSRLHQEKEELVKKHKEDLALKNEEINANNLRYNFLAKMITKTGDELVSSVIEFLKWLGFENAIDADENRKTALKEEDINIETDRGLIVIEVKGIGSVPADSDCNQIGKVRTRRQNERKNFDVFAQLIVNHERHKPAASRINPPFSKEQLQDAEYDTRGLITTWQLFNVFRAVENGIITKESVRECFYKSGLASFIPENMVSLGSPAEILNKAKVIIINLNGTAEIRPDDRLMYKVGDEFHTVTILSIKQDDEFVQFAQTGELGLKLTDLVPKTAVLYAYPRG